MIAQNIFLGFVGPWQWIIIGLAILLLFGGKKIPELMKGMGKGIKEFKGAIKDDESADMTTNDKKLEEDKATTTATSTEAQTSTTSETTKTTV